MPINYQISNISIKTKNTNSKNKKIIENHRIILNLGYIVKNRFKNLDN